jgi:hypothetical protein
LTTPGFGSDEGREAVRALVRIAVVVGLLVAVASAGGAVKPQRISLLEVEKSFLGTGGLDPTGTAPPAPGQGFVLESDLYRWKGVRRGAHVGTLHAVCTFTDVHLKERVAHSVCTGIASLPAGQILVSGVVGEGNRFVLPIAGGTGAFTGAKGVVRIKNIGGGDSNASADVFVITG